MGQMLVVLEDIRSQNRATIEAVWTLSDRVDRRIDALSARLDVVEHALLELQAHVMRNSEDIKALRAEVAALSSALTRKVDVDRVASLEARVTRLEQNLSP